TQKDVDRIQAEIEERKLVERPRLLEAVKEARAQGDLSENFEYTAAKREKNRNESRIRYLERVLKNASIVKDYSRDDEVGIEKTVRVMFEDDCSEEDYRIVTPIRCNSLENKISIESPIGKALMGHKAGDRVEVPLPNGAVNVLRILAVSNTVDDGTDRLRSY
ncbi:MAG: transcription elongation factor GreA, partial [Lachnospiraceae bacterium]|nr:transcription elongation factor GreA [Lachnospiraceae bacterium]